MSLGTGIVLATILVLFCRSTYPQRAGALLYKLRWVGLGVVLLGLLGLGGVFMQRDRKARVDAAIASAQAAAVSAGNVKFQEQIRTGQPDGRWLPIALGTNAQYWVDLQTIERPPDRYGQEPFVRIWIKVLDHDNKIKMEQVSVDCHGEGMTPWEYQPGTIAETVSRWVQQSQYCPSLADALDLGTKPADKAPTAPAVKDPHAYTIAVTPWAGIKHIVVKSSRALSAEEQKSFEARVKIDCPSNWFSCKGTLPDGARYTTEQLTE